MLEQLELLLALSQIDSELQDVVGEHESLPEDRLDDMRKDRQRLERELEDLSAKLSDLMSKQLLIKTNEEYAALSLEIEHAKSQISDTEDAILRGLELADECVEELDAAREVAASAERDLGSRIAGLRSELKRLEEAGYEYEAAEASFDLIIRRHLGRYKPLLELQNYHLESFKSGDSHAKTVGRLFLKTDGGKELMGAAAGYGPVETLDRCLRDALLHSHPFLERIKLIDYAVRVLNPEEAAAAKVRVFITFSDGQKSWETVGVSENIVEASWQALVDSMEYYFNENIAEGNESA